MAEMKLLLTGATGYIGGSVLTALLKSKHESVLNVSISVVVRQESQARVFAEQGLNVTPVIIADLAQVEPVVFVASEHDVVIGTTPGFRTSGASNLGEKPITGQASAANARIFSDEEDIYAYEVSRDAAEAYDQRTVDLAIVNAGIEHGFKTYIITPPTIWGVGTGLFNKAAIQIPSLIKSTIRYGKAEVIGDGMGVWNRVCISDLATLYEAVLAKVLAGEDIPYGEKGIYFAEAGHGSWKDLSQAIADAGMTLGALKSNEVHSITLKEGADKWMRGDLQLAELNFASNAVTKGELGLAIGWIPEKTEEDFQANFRMEFERILKDGK